MPIPPFVEDINEKTDRIEADVARLGDRVRTLEISRRDLEDQLERITMKLVERGILEGK